MSSVQFYHLSADATLPCYHLNRTGLIIISPRTDTLTTKTYKETYTTSTISQIHSLCLRQPVRRWYLYNEWFYSYKKCRLTCGDTGHGWVLLQSSNFCVPDLLNPVWALGSGGEDLYLISINSIKQPVMPFGAHAFCELGPQSRRHGLRLCVLNNLKRSYLSGL